MKFYILVVLMTMLGFTTQAQSFDDKAHQTLKNYLTEFPNQTQFSVAVLNGNKTNYYGLVKFSDTINQLDNSASVFQIGSVTKVFTSTLLAQLVLENKVELSDSIQYYFSFPLKENKITLESLSNHSSGLPRLPSNLNLATANLKNPYQSYAEADLDYYLSTEMEFSSGDQPSYQYSNLGAAILAKALENATGKTFAELLSEKIFQPLEMKNSSLDKDSVGGNLVQGLDASGNPTPVWDMGQFGGAGAILSTTTDLSRFVNVHFQNAEDAYSLTTLPTYMVNDNLRIGLGWHILQDEQDNNLYWHNGGTGGYSSSVFMVPETQKAVIILSNVSAYHPKAPSIDELAFKLLKSLLPPKRDKSSVLKENE
ncbi:serine hydrolase domain-containing protein [Psychroflexus sediminis]|uniref:CubicO group peptidase, beta-lactamase class C family n=1 Tax=Psychroflexus sediminis TaxID=470826 RepID=A0A1G7TX19_9FLAO|nr:serine hydrolase domain-containing protein [Psychroflexus sediminis]SDG39792.1 CubicO group peptidase, beta-lactamase class C family [Psychroflexus sediminis]